MNNRDGYVSQRVLHSMSLPVPSAYHLDYVLRDISKDYGISWSPDPPPRDFMSVLDPLYFDMLSYSLSVNSLSEYLNEGTPQDVDLKGLRKLCLRGKDSQD